jgi:starch synthase (maltosyl-transferring)
MLSPTYGVYSGFELFEHLNAKPGSEEYLDSEKYQLRPRDFEAALSAGRSLQPWITRLNGIRRAHPALQQLREITFHHIDNDALIAYSKTDPGTGDTVIVVVNLNPYGAEQGTLWLDQPAMDMSWDQHFVVHDEVTGESYPWGQGNFVRLEPWKAVAHVMHVLR